jgi:hypothetical protein
MTQSNIRRTPPPPAKRQAALEPEQASVSFGRISKATSGHRVVLYGPGGIGKTTLACSMPGPVAFFDLDESLDKLLPSLEERGIADNVVPVQGAKDWQGIRDALHAPGWDGIKTVVVDTATKAEELALAWMFANIKNNGAHVSRLEDYGYKSGYRHLFDTYSLLLADLDVHARAGRNVVLICHDCAARVPNPQGQDWIRYEPRLAQDDKYCQLRFRVKEWADHVFAMLYDVNVEKGKGQGSGTRTVYATELPHCMAKSRTTNGAFPLTDGAGFWSETIM